MFNFIFLVTHGIHLVNLYFIKFHLFFWIIYLLCRFCQYLCTPFSSLMNFIGSWSLWLVLWFSSSKNIDIVINEVQTIVVVPIMMWDMECESIWATKIVDSGYLDLQMVHMNASSIHNEGCINLTMMLKLKMMLYKIIHYHTTII